MKIVIAAVLGLMLSGCEPRPPYEYQIPVDNGLLKIGDDVYLKKIEISPDQVHIGSKYNDRVYILVNKDSVLYNKLQSPVSQCHSEPQGKSTVNKCSTVINGDLIKAPVVTAPTK